MPRDHYTVTKTSTDAFEEVAGGVRGSYQRIVRLLEEEVLSGEEFEFWEETTWILVEALKKLDAVAKKAEPKPPA